MKPEDFRRIDIAVGTKIGLLGDDGNVWTPNDRTLFTTLESYLVVERWHTWDHKPEWDAGAIVRSFSSIDSHGTDSQHNNQQFQGDTFLVYPRSPYDHWLKHEHMNVFVYGLLQDVSTNKLILPLHEWKPYSLWLAGQALLMVEDEEPPTEIARLVRQTENR